MVGLHSLRESTCGYYGPSTLASYPGRCGSAAICFVVAYRPPRTHHAVAVVAAIVCRHCTAPPNRNQTWTGPTSFGHHHHHFLQHQHPGQRYAWANTCTNALIRWTCDDLKSIKIRTANLAFIFLF